jgi:NADH-quinone oxidoreductase subunit N
MPVNPSALTVNFRHVYLLAPEIVLTVWGFVVLLADLGPLRKRSPDDRRRLVGRLALVGALITLAASLLPMIVRNDSYGLQETLNFAGIDYQSYPDPMLFYGSLSSDIGSEPFKLLIALLLPLVIWMSTAWSFTENWGEYYALMLWSTVGMMLLLASEELLTLFLTLEMMTICLYLATAFEKDKRRSAEAGLKYFVYGSVSSALFLFGLSLIYGLTGSTQFSAIDRALQPVPPQATGLLGNVVGMAALTLVLVGFGFKIAAVPFHQWAPDAYEGAPAPVTAWVATGSKVASFIALMKVLLHALGYWSHGAEGVVSPGWIGVVVVLSAASMTYGNFAALAQKNLKRMLAYSSIAHAGYMLVGVAAAAVSVEGDRAAGAVLFYLVVYAFSNIGAFAVAAWLARDKGSDEIADLDGLGRQHPGLAVCILLLMLSLIGMPPLAGFFGKLYMFMEALDQPRVGKLTLMWLVALGLLNSVVSAFYYVRVLKAMFLRPPSGAPLHPAPTSIALPIVLATAVVVGLGVYPSGMVDWMRQIAVPLLEDGGSYGQDRMYTPVTAAAGAPDRFTPLSPPPGVTPPAPPGRGVLEEAKKQ